MTDISFVLKVIFYRSEAGNEPVREWLKDLHEMTSAKSVKISRPLDKDLWEVRTRLSDGIARVFFTVDGEFMILLHGFMKKSQKTPQNELKTALSRLGTYKRGTK